MPVVSSGSLTITDLNDSVLLSLSLPSVSLPADAAGTVSSYSTAVTTARVMQGGVDVTSSWTLSKVDSSCTSTLSSGVVTVSAMSADSAYVDVTASRAGWPTLTARFALSKAKQGATGATGATGPAGAAGISTAVVYLYQRAASTPAVPSATLTWTFTTNTLSGTLGAWTTAVPAGTDPLYVTVATAASAGATDTIGTAEWATPVILAQNGAAGATGATGATGAAGATGATGAAGATGATAATVYLFQRTASATAPALPSASVTYTFGSAVATGLTNGWTQTMPTTGGAYRWITTATALGTGATDTIGTAEWAAAALMAQDGTGTNLIDTSTWQPGSTFPAGWSVWQDTPIAGNETQFVQAAGPTGQLTTVLECTADSVNKCYTPQFPFSPLSFWFLDGATTTNIAPTVVVDTTNGWTADGSTTYSGNCFKITKASSTTASQGIVSRAVAVTPGETLRIRVRVRADAASTTGLYIRINQATSMPASGSVSASNRASSTDLAANVACTSTYTTYQNLTYVVPAGIVAISLCVFSHYNVSPASAGPLILYVDDPTINRAAYGDSATGPRQSAEGGWSPSPAVPINPTQTYRFVLPICRKTALYHHAYFGPLANQVCLLNTSTLATNSYFWGGDATSLTVDEWYLVVGYVYPAGSTGQTSDSAGVWRISTGQRVIAGTNVCWPAGATSVQTRAAQYYGDNGAKIQVGKPWMHVVDGTEPPLRSLTAVSVLPDSGIVIGAGVPVQVGNSFIPTVANAAATGVGLVWEERLGNWPNQFWGIEPLIPGRGINIIDSESTPGVTIESTLSERYSHVAGADQSFASTTAADISVFGLITLEPYSAYLVEGVLLYKGTATGTGIKIDHSIPSGATGYGKFQPQSQDYFQIAVPFGTGMTLIPVANTTYFCEVRAIVITGSAGGQYLLKAGVNGSGTLTIQAGSTVLVRKTGAFSPPAVTLASSLGAAPVYFVQASASTARSTSASLTLSVKTDGTWSIVGARSPEGGLVPSASGNWGTPTAQSAGFGYEARFTTLAQSVDVSVSNGAASWSQISSNRVISAIMSAPTGVSESGSVIITAEVRKIGTTSPVCVSTMAVNLSCTGWVYPSTEGEGGGE